MFLILFFLLNICINICAMEVDIITVSPERWQEFRALRLEAVTVDPQAIGGSREDEEKRSLESYKDLLEQSQKAEDLWLVFAQQNNELIGVAGAMCKMKHISVCRHVATLISVYLRPEFRGQGIGERLIRSVLEKLTTSTYVTEVNLFVTTTQIAAINLYKKCGFTTCGKLSNALIISGQTYDQDIMQRHIEKV
jgi:ribosomal protein S18 acetylase RimI-like enzyme